jgi:hypothetical protein
MPVSLNLRYSLKALFVGVLIVCIGCAHLSLLVTRAREQANAVQRMQQLGATIFYDFQHYYDRGWCISRSRKPTDWTWAPKLFGNDLFSSVYRVEFQKASQPVAELRNKLACTKAA